LLVWTRKLNKKLVWNPGQACQVSRMSLVRSTLSDVTGEVDLEMMCFLSTFGS